MFIDWGDGWTPCNYHDSDVAALDGFSIQWGTDGIDQQPDPSVMSFRLRDSTGWLTGRALTLSGARVLVQISEQPTWGMLRADMGTWATRQTSLGMLHQQYSPPTPSHASSTATTLFAGIVQSGGSALPHGNGWLLHLTASSHMLLWKRLQKQGPTSSDARYTDLHWVGNIDERLDELNRRAETASAPTASANGLDSTASVAPYKTDDYPSQLDLLHRTFAHDASWPIWYEYPDRDGSRLDYMPFGQPAGIGADAMGRLTITCWTGETLAGLSASDIITDTEQTLTIPAPVTQFVIQGKKAKSSDGRLEFEQHDTTINASGRLPHNLTLTQSSISVESDAVSADESNGVWTRGGGSVWAPSASETKTFIQVITAMDSRLRPETIVFDSRRLDPAKHARLYLTASSGPIVFQGATSSRLTGSDSRPAAGGAWASIGGTLTYQWSGGRPMLRNEVTLWPLPVSGTHAIIWSDMGTWPVTWARTAFTLAELSLITDYAQSRIMEETS